MNLFLVKIVYANLISSDCPYDSKAITSIELMKRSVCNRATYLGVAILAEPILVTSKQTIRIKILCNHHLKYFEEICKSFPMK